MTTHAPARAVYGSQFTVAANAPGGAIAYSSSGSCTNSGATFTITSASGTCTVKYDQAGNSNYKAAPAVTEAVNAVAAFGGFQAPLPNAVLKAGSKITVKFTLTDASGHPLAAAAAAALAAAGSVEVTLTGPNGNTTQLASALCTWVTKGQFFQCNLKTPSGLKTGTTNPYSLTAMQNVGGHYLSAPPYTNTASDANPETIFLLSQITVSAHVGKRQVAARPIPPRADLPRRPDVSCHRRRSAALHHPALQARSLEDARARGVGGSTTTTRQRSRSRASKTGRYRARASFAGDTIHPRARSAWKRFRVR